MDNAQLFDQLSQGLSKIEDPTTRVGLAMQIFGSELAGSTVISTARSSADNGFYTRNLEIQDPFNLEIPDQSAIADCPE